MINYNSMTLWTTWACFYLRNSQIWLLLVSGGVAEIVKMKSWCLTPCERCSVSLIHLDMPAIFHSVSSRAAQHESQIKFNYPASVRINSRVENMTGERASHVIGDGLRIQPQVKESSQSWTKGLIMQKKKKKKCLHVKCEKCLHVQLVYIFYFIFWFHFNFSHFIVFFCNFY